MKWQYYNMIPQAGGRRQEGKLNLAKQLWGKMTISLQFPAFVHILQIPF